MAIVSREVTLGTSAVELADGDRDGTDVLVTSASAEVHLGGSDVTTANGVPLSTTGTFTFTLKHNESLYGIAASGTPTVRVITNGSGAL